MRGQVERKNTKKPSEKQDNNRGEWKGQGGGRCIKSSKPQGIPPNRPTDPIALFLLAETKTAGLVESTTKETWDLKTLPKIAIKVVGSISGGLGSRGLGSRGIGIVTAQGSRKKTSMQMRSPRFLGSDSLYLEGKITHTGTVNLTVKYFPRSPPVTIRRL